MQVPSFHPCLLKPHTRPALALAQHLLAGRPSGGRAPGLPGPVASRRAALPDAWVQPPVRGAAPASPLASAGTQLGCLHPEKTTILALLRKLLFSSLLGLVFYMFLLS